VWFKWLALKEFKPSGGGGIVLPDYLPEHDLQLEIDYSFDEELEIEDICDG